MSKTIITTQFEQYLQEKNLAGLPTNLNEIIFAYIPDLDINSEDRNITLPPIEQWVHQQDVDQIGKAGANAVVYSVLPDVKNTFTFNAMFLRDKNHENGLAVAVYKALETKEATSVVVKSIVTEFTGAAEAAQITVDAATWQIDFSRRLNGISSDISQSIVDQYGKNWFVDSGFLVTTSGSTFSVRTGVGYINGYRLELRSDTPIQVPNKPTFIYIDAYRSLNVLAEQTTEYSFVVTANELTDYVDDDIQHFVCKIAQVTNEKIVDLRPENQITALARANSFVLNKDNTLQKDVSFTDKFIEYCTLYSDVIIDDVEIWLSANVIPQAAKISKLIVKNGGVIRFDDSVFTIEVEAKNFVIDLTQGGKMHVGLRKVKVARDHAMGETVIDVVDASDLRVGDHLATSMMGDDGDGNKWANSLRNIGDSYNVIKFIESNRVTVTNPVGAKGLPKNAWLGNAFFGKNGLYFKGADKSFTVSILGGEIIEAAAGYYVAVTSNFGTQSEDSYFIVRGTKFNGQFLDGFLLRGEKIHTSFDENWDIYKSYDIAKQTFICDTRGNIDLRNGRLRRGNFDVEFYYTDHAPSFVGGITMHNVICDGQSTLDITPEQINELTNERLDATWSNAGDSVHLTQWKFNKPTSVGGFKATQCKFRNYRRALLGTTFVPMQYDLHIDGDIELADCQMDCPPHYFETSAEFDISGEIKYNNLFIKIKYADPYYLSGLIRATNLTPLPTFSGVTTLKTTAKTQQPNSCTLGTTQLLRCISDNASTVISLTPPYRISTIIADNANVRKTETGQDNYLTETIKIGAGNFIGESWHSKITAKWNDNEQTLHTNGIYAGTCQKNIYRKITEIENWHVICGLKSMAIKSACELHISATGSYSGASFINATFILSLLPDSSEVTARFADVSADIVTIDKTRADAIATSIVESNSGITDASDFNFRLTASNTLEMKVGGTTDMAMLINVKGNVVSL